MTLSPLHNFQGSREFFYNDINSVIEQTMSEIDNSQKAA